MQHSAAETRAKFTARKSSLRKWALKRGHKLPTVYAAINGHRDGPLSQQILRELRKELRG